MYIVKIKYYHIWPHCHWAHSPNPVSTAWRRPANCLWAPIIIAQCAVVLYCFTLCSKCPGTVMPMVSFIPPRDNYFETARCQIQRINGCINPMQKWFISQRYSFLSPNNCGLVAPVKSWRHVFLQNHQHMGIGVGERLVLVIGVVCVNWSIIPQYEYRWSKYGICGVAQAVKCMSWCELMRELWWHRTYSVFRVK